MLGVSCMWRREGMHILPGRSCKFPASICFREQGIEITRANYVGGLNIRRGAYLRVVTFLMVCEYERSGSFLLLYCNTRCVFSLGASGFTRSIPLLPKIRLLACGLSSSYR